MAVMEFACSYDEGKLASESQSPSDSAQGMVRAKAEIDLLIKGHNLDGLTKSVLYSKKDYVAFYKRMSRPEPVFGCDADKSGIDKRLSDALAESGITRLYEFQHTSIKKILLGKNIIIDAPTASGKTEAFLIPVLHMACTQHAKGPSVLILYPTKALAQDQYPKVKKFASAVNLKAEVFDGDVGAAHRSKIIQERPDIIVTNFDVLHYHMMRRTSFASLLANVRFVIADEAHVYTGIFGSNVHYILKRLKRLTSNAVQFVASSATLRDPGDFCTKLFGEEMERVTGQGVKSKVDFVMLFPSVRTQRSLMSEL